MRTIFKPLAISLITVVSVFICFFTFTKIFGPIPFFVQNITTTKDTLFTVSGTGEVTVIPDTALISLGVTKTDSTVTSAQSQVNSVINKITDDLKNMGIDPKNIKTTNYSVNPQYDYSSGSNVVKGYQVDASLEVKVNPIDKVNNAVDVATKDGANQVGNIQFVVDDAKQKELEDQARKQAIVDAKSKAQSMSSAAGIQLGRIVDVQENNETPRPMPMMANSAALKAGGGEATQLNPGENKITTTITLSYETY